MRISDWSSDVCSSDLPIRRCAEGADPRTVVWDGMFVAFIVSAAGSALLLLFPQLMYPAGEVDSADRWMALLVFVIAGTDIALAACAYKFDVGATVRARAIVEPWVISRSEEHTSELQSLMRISYA